MRLNYKDLSKLNTFEERFRYLKLLSKVGVETFGFDRYINQRFYRSAEWKRVRDTVIMRDNGCDLGIKDRVIFGKVLIHHMNPIAVTDIDNCSDILLNPDYLITVSLLTHNAIHFGDENQLIRVPKERKPNDTCPWKKEV